jgi:hypothetical protein
MYKSGRQQKPQPSCQAVCHGWRRHSRTGMNQGRTGIRRFRRLFGYFLVAQKVSRRRNRVQSEASIKIIFTRIRTTDKEVIYEQEDTWTAQLCRHEEIIYAEALKDGILFGYMVALVWQGGEVKV